MKNSKSVIIALAVIVGIIGVSYYVSAYINKRAAERREAQEQIHRLVARLADPSSTPMAAEPYFITPGDVTIVTDGNDFRLQPPGGMPGPEVFATKQEAIEYIRQTHKIMNPAEGKNYQPAP